MVSKKRVMGRKAKPKAGKKTKVLKTLKPKKTVRKPEMVRLLADPASVTPLPIRVESFDQPVPKVTIETAEFFLDGQESLRILDSGGDL